VRKTPPPEEYTTEYYLTDCEGFRDFSSGGISARHKKVLAYLEVKPQQRVIDIGCGRGELVRECNRLGAWAIGIDYSPAAVRISHHTAKQGVIITASATHLPFRGGTFDKVILIDVVEHLDKSDLCVCLGEINRVLRRGGVLLIETPNTWRKLVGWWSRFTFRPEQLALFSAKSLYYVQTMHVNEQNPLSLKRILHQNGFSSKIRFHFPEIAYLSFWKTTIYRIFFLCGPIWCRARKK